MLLKAGVDISRLRPEIRKKLPLLDDLLRGFGEELIITSTFEGTHSAGSLHYANLAIDVRVPKADKGLYVNAWRRDLGRDYDVVVERDHIHIEYDPK